MKGVGCVQACAMRKLCAYTAVQLAVTPRSDGCGVAGVVWRVWRGGCGVVDRGEALGAGVNHSTV